MDDNNNGEEAEDHQGKATTSKGKNFKDECFKLSIEHPGGG